MKAMLLAAGRSTRLGALGEALPKPLVPICGYPAIHFGLRACARAGLTSVVVNLHHHEDLLRRAVGDGAAFGVQVTYSPEAELLGTGGGVAAARARGLLGDAGEPVLVMNAKVVADIDLAALVAAHRASGADATLVLRDDPAARDWGPVGADPTGRVVSILDAVAPGRRAGTVVDRMFTGVQIIGPAILDRLRPVFCDTVRDGYIPAMMAGADIRAFVHTGYFAEHSTPERYLQGNVALLRRPDLLGHPPGPLVGIDPTARVHPDANIRPPVRIDAGAIVEADAVVGPDVVVGAGATVSAGVRLSRAVVWPGVQVTADQTGAVLTPKGVVLLTGPA